MDKLRKVGLTALAGTLAIGSAQAARNVCFWWRRFQLTFI